VGAALCLGIEPDEVGGCAAMRLGSIIFSVLTLLFPLVATGLYGADERPPLQLRATDLPDPWNPNPMYVSDVEVLKAFTRKYPWIEPRRFTGVRIEGQSRETQTLMAIAAKMAPDLLGLTFHQIDTYVRQGFLYPLDKFAAGMSEEELDERVPRRAWPAIKRNGPDGKQHLWALPYAALARWIMYRRDVLYDAGIDPPRPPRNWAELKEYARRLTDPEKGTYGVGVIEGEDRGAWEWLTYLWGAGGRAMKQDSDGEWRAAFEGAEAAEAMLFYVDLFTERWVDAKGKTRHGYVAQGNSDFIGQNFDNAKIGFITSYLDFKTITDEERPGIYMIAPLPIGPTGERSSEINCRMWGMFSDIEARDGYSVEEIRDAAWKFIQFWGSDEAHGIRTRVYIDAGLGSIVNPVLLKKFGYDEYLEGIPKDWVETLEDALRNGRPEPYGKNCQAIYRFMGRPITQCLELARRGKLGETRAEKLEKIQQVLHKAVAYTNEHMVGAITPRERRTRNTVAFVVAVLVMAAFAETFRRVWIIFTPEEGVQKGGWRFRRYAWAYIILLPAAVSIFLWQYMPMIMGLKMAVQDYRVVGESAFVGVQNFADVLWDAAWWWSIVRTLYYMLLFLGLGFWTPIALAILLHEVSRLKILYRTVYYLPAMLTGFVVIYLWKLLFDPSDVGTLNQMLNAFGVPSLAWLNDRRLAMLCCVIPTVWAGLGPGCLIYLAAMKAVPNDLYEAADIDGAGFRGKIRHVTLPTLKAIIIIQFIASFIAASQSAGWILVMSGMRESTKVVGLEIFERAYMHLRFGSAVAMAWILGVLLLTFTVQQLKILSRMEFKAAEPAR